MKNLLFLILMSGLLLTGCKTETESTEGESGETEVSTETETPKESEEPAVSFDDAVYSKDIARHFTVEFEATKEEMEGKVHTVRGEVASVMASEEEKLVYMNMADAGGSSTTMSVYFTSATDLSDIVGSDDSDDESADIIYFEGKLEEVSLGNGDPNMSFSDAKLLKVDRLATRSEE